MGLDAFPEHVAVAAARDEHGCLVIGLPDISALVLTADDDELVVGTRRDRRQVEEESGLREEANGTRMLT